MAELLAVGKEFKSFDALQDAVHQYEQTCFTQLSRTDSRTIGNEESRRSSKLFNPDIKYSFVTFTCAFGGKPYVSRSTGIRNSKPRIKCNCPVTLKCFATADGQKLVIRHSALDCHNHDTSEESFKALPRGKLLDEETELEIYNLIESHENKKLARKLVREKLIEETGRDITYKDIQNIEKRMGKKKDQPDRNGRSEDEDVSDTSMPSDQEDEGKEMGENTSRDKAEGNDESSPDKNEKSQKAKTTPKKKSSAKPSTQNRSSGRPKRAIREPTRFRDPAVAVSSSVLKRRGSESENSWEESDSELSIKKEPQSSSKRGRPRKIAKIESKSSNAKEEESSDTGSEGEQERPKKKSNSDSIANRKLDLEERQLKIQEEMLNLQRQSMMLLQNVVQKLDRVEANQKGEVAAEKDEVTTSTTTTTVEHQSPVKVGQNIGDAPYKPESVTVNAIEETSSNVDEKSEENVSIEKALVEEQATANPNTESAIKSLEEGAVGVVV